MINRIRVVTLLVMVLGGIRTVTVLISGSLFFFPSP